MFGKAAILSQFFMPRRGKLEDEETDLAQSTSIVEKGHVEGSDHSVDKYGAKVEEVDSHSHFDTDAISLAPTASDYTPGEFKMKHRYLPIVSGLACPFSVLLDVSSFLSLNSSLRLDAADSWVSALQIPGLTERVGRRPVS